MKTKKRGNGDLRLVRSNRIADLVEENYRRYHLPEYLDSDPLSVVRRFPREDREMAAFFAAMLSYGGVGQIKASLGKLFDAMDGEPARFVRRFDSRDAAARLGDWKHRFTEAEDMVLLTGLLHEATRRRGLESIYLSCREPDGFVRARDFIHHILSRQPSGIDVERIRNKPGFRHLVADPSRGSACKRLHMFLRWVSRPDDGIDLGLWKQADLDCLVVPVDTHVLRLARNLGLTARKTADARTAAEITAGFARIDRDDPVRFDFSFCRIGILKECPARITESSCTKCRLKEACIRHHPQA